MDVAHAIAKRFNLPEERIVHVRDRAFNDQRCACTPHMALCNVHGSKMPECTALGCTCPVSAC